MDIKSHVQLHAFELVYLLTLAFLPFVVALKEVTVAILAVLTVMAIVALIKYLRLRKVDPNGKVVFISGCDTGTLLIIITIFYMACTFCCNIFCSLYIVFFYLMI